MKKSKMVTKADLKRMKDEDRKEDRKMMRESKMERKRKKK